MEKKIKQLEEAVKSLREPLEKTLLDVRETIGNIENPFAYVSALLGQKAEGRRTDDSQNASPLGPAPRETSTPARGQVPAFSQHPIPETYAPRAPTTELSRFLNVIAAANLMMTLVGKEQVLEMVNMLGWKGVITKELADDVKEALEISSKTDLGFHMETVPPQAPGTGSMLVVLYLLSKIAKDDNDPMMLLLFMAFERGQIMAGLHGRRHGV